MPKVLEVVFDGDVFRPTRPIGLKPDTKMEIMIADENEDWSNLSLRHLSDAYGTDEPDYSINSVKEENPEYEGV
jgi:predicted DNA-binding antitoxin AbrB/MazE fold protein